MHFDPSKLLENAVASIQVGIEDFNSEDERRPLSAIRNIFAGVLLLFKYRIATAVDKDGELLIFDLTPEPTRDRTGVSVEIRKTTIDVVGIKRRFKALGISLDLNALDKLQDERNFIEHLHPRHAPNVLSQFIADLFPLLKEFIEIELKESPVNLLGDECWTAMLNHHQFFEGLLSECRDAWSRDLPGKLTLFFTEIECPECCGVLLRPVSGNGSSFELDDKFECLACGHMAEAGPLLEDALVDSLGGFDFASGEDNPVDTCPTCMNRMFVMGEGACAWCGSELEYEECRVCEARLSPGEQDLGGVCGYHANQAED